ncbi:hypothetical protein GCM10027321_21800 [Massilia terrae]|uniref:TIGR03016 family PEP-CTERM system-associated outer membrane protein n=1 Tax=Massilia terrae TaxID=1811224 RepID=A0ABT2CZC3_9BURK|nr:TIGR03016 family PEP-CTERM system-associated outer membrane protein [Massilia terrae]MCS0658926.1 TIGR03016 family PEP-CTERM system-associated outer membrane protein [Massilia terrae]
MAITTAKLPRLAPLALALLSIAPAAHAGWRFTPTIGMTETVTDNVNLQPDDQRRTAWVTEAVPGFQLAGSGTRYTLQAMAQEHLFGYSGSRLPGTRDSQFVYGANGQARVVDDWFYVDASAGGGPRTASAFGPQAEGNLWATGNLVNVRSWRISPYLRHRFGSTATVEVRYARDSLEQSGNQVGTGEGRSWTANVASGPSFYTLGWSLDYNRQDLDNKLFGESSAKNVQGTLRWRLARTFALTAGTGYDSYDYQSLGGRTSGHSWSAGFICTPSVRTDIRISAGHRFYGPTGALDASHRMRHSVWTAHYSDTITNSRQQMFLPASYDTSAMLDKMFTASIPDPVQRAATVQAYMVATGLPPTLTDSINYLSNRWLREKNAQLGLALNGAHGTLMLSLFDDKRTALSAIRTDSDLLGSAIAALNDNVHQRGFSSAYNYRASARTNALLIANISRVTSITTGITQDVSQLRFRVTRDLSRRSQAAIEVRRAHGGSSNLNTQTYTENAVSATLSMRF